MDLSKIRLKWPVSKPIVSQFFGENPDIYSRFGFPGHNGIDLAGLPEGHPVTAAADGKVKKVAYDPSGYGNYIILDHNGYETLYAHLQETCVGMSQPVGAGQVIGKLGTTGFSTGPHLHFELRIPGQNPEYKGRVDPLPFFEAVVAPVPSDAPKKSGMKKPGEKIKVSAGVANIRSAPDLTPYTVIGQLNRGVQLEVLRDAGEFYEVLARFYISKLVIEE